MRKIIVVEHGYDNKRLNFTFTFIMATRAGKDDVVARKKIPNGYLIAYYTDWPLHHIQSFGGYMELIADIDFDVVMLNSESITPPTGSELDILLRKSPIMRKYL